MLTLALRADTLGAARKAGLHLNCGHDDSPQSAAECLQSCVGAPCAGYQDHPHQPPATPAQLGSLPSSHYGLAALLTVAPGAGMGS